ncbi:substrate-binding periplasmic protein [Litoribrevibacter euphylliae]|uniref:Substrate-binding periplasmic protein n=1 Tax=Litoribrevibacter euphylliae TaxID=1834034 RepID=A0ABV7HAM0_9GAMM
MIRSNAVFYTLFVGVLLFSGFVNSDTKTTDSNEKLVHLTSLEWPPYSGEQLPDGGASIALAKQAFKHMGYELIVDFYPWSRAVYNGTNKNSRYAGYFPEYYSPKLADTLYFSNEIGDSPLGLIEHVSNPVEWQRLEDLQAYSLGVVRDYVNTQALDTAIAEGNQPAQEVTSDAQNIRKVAGKRIPLAVIDPFVFDYLLLTDESLRFYRNDVQMNSQLLENKKLYICFQKTE